MSRSYKSTGFVLSRKNYGEADRVLRLFTQDYGQLSVLAKGVRKPKSRKRGHIEVFSKVRFSAVKGKGFDILTEAELLVDYEKIRINVKKTLVAYYFCECLLKLTREQEQQKEVFELLDGYFNKLENGVVNTKLRHSFVRELLDLLGYWPLEKDLPDPDAFLESITERKINTSRIGRQMLKK